MSLENTAPCILRTTRRITKCFVQFSLTTTILHDCEWRKRTLLGVLLAIQRRVFSLSKNKKIVIFQKRFDSFQKAELLPVREFSSGKKKQEEDTERTIFQILESNTSFEATTSGEYSCARSVASTGYSKEHQNVSSGYGPWCNQTHHETSSCRGSTHKEMVAAGLIGPRSREHKQR